MEFVAIKDTYAQSGKPAELLERYGLTAKDIQRSVRSAIKRK
jgi:transketolase